MKIARLPWLIAFATLLWAAAPHAAQAYDYSTPGYRDAYGVWHNPDGSVPGAWVDAWGVWHLGGTPGYRDDDGVWHNPDGSVPGRTEEDERYGRSRYETRDCR